MGKGGRGGEGEAVIKHLFHKRALNMREQITNEVRSVESDYKQTHPINANRIIVFVKFH